MKKFIHAILLLSLTALAAVAQEYQLPVPNNDEYTTDWDTVLTVSAPGLLANDSSPMGYDLQAHINQWPTQGSLDMNIDGSFSYTPDPNYQGQVTFSYNCYDGLQAVPATVTINITAGNQAPVANDDEYSMTLSQGRLYVDAPGVMSNDSDPEGDELITHLAQQPAAGVLGFSNDGSFWYEPEANFTGKVSFMYNLTDGLAETSATVTITVGDDTPVLAARDDEYSVPVWGEVTVSPFANDTYGENTFYQVHSISWFIDVWDNGDGTFDVHNWFGLPGTYYFDYTLSNGNLVETATVSINVEIPQPTIEAKDDTVVLPLGGQVTFNPFSNDESTDGDIYFLTYTNCFWGPDLVYNGDGTFTAYDWLGWPGNYYFHYVIYNNSWTDLGTVTLSVQ